MKNQSIILILVLIILLSSIIPITSSLEVCSNNIIYVDDDGGADYTKIQDAIDNASDGDTIYVYGGFYQERIYIDRSINLNGEDIGDTIIDGGKNGDVIRITKSSVSVSNFTIQNRSIDEVHDGISLSYCYDISIIDNNFIDCGISYGFLTPNIITYRATIKNNIVNDKPLIYLEGIKNEIIDYPTGQIILSDCDNITISNQNISNLHNGIFLFHSNNCTLYKNKITDSSKGIVLYYSIYNNISENILTDNLMGILFGASNHTIFIKNSIESNERGIYDNIYPFVAGSNSIKITKNIIKNNFEGVNLVWSTHAFIEYNNVEDNNYIGIWIGSSSESFIEHNNFYSNNKDVYPMELINTNYTIINENYWGRARIFPKPIYGRIKYREGLFNSISWIFFDWHPVKEPFDI